MACPGIALILDNTRPSANHCQTQSEQLVLPLHPAALIPLVTRHFYYPEEVFALSKQIDGVPNAYGSFSLAALRVMNFLAQRQRQWFYEPLNNSKQIFEVLRFNDLLRQGPVPEWSLPHITVAFEAFNSIFTAPGGRVPQPKPHEAKRGEHSVILTGGWEDAGDWLQFRNSWGPGWGDEGFGYLSQDYLDHHLVDAWLTRDASVGLSRLTYRRLVDARSDTERATIWLLPNPRWRRQSHRGSHGYQLVVYETLSTAEGCPVQVIEVRTGFGIRVGWAHLFHLGGNSRTSLLKELYVWPPFRRRGYGTILESVATENARAWGSRRLQVLLHEMDAQPASRIAGDRFAERSGYQWYWHKSARPDIEAIGEKML